ncbi:hypothetical protein AYO21_12077 [Fonsecaea monophora]|uniref:Uncharacterized protein n=1 Tax=Fonsecaea monophora TaxID=254056 RepID=A0A177ES65_9EURO|nr:hypothetical protein AYO21_12077 [Fonsecaea monophora]KAH0843048.1 hypothetical protein FOPE_08333 [Fonsecaea pedrosoi]OAG33829.1 hypothetical protein AYO21_12077 [Fonsecaea monophora]
MVFSVRIGAIITTAVTVAFTPLAAVASSSSATSGSYTLCQFYSSIPGLSSADSTTLTLPLCPSSLLTFSYTIPPETTSTTPIEGPTTRTWAPSPSVTSSLTLCQFYSSIPGLSSPSTTPVSSMTLPSCPASLQGITYSFQAPMGTSGGSATGTALSATSATSTAAVVSSFTGAAAPRPSLDRMVLGGVGVGGILAGAVGMMA